MHAYATDSRERVYIPFFLAGFALAAAFGLSSLLGLLSVELPFWLPTLDVLGFYGLFHWLFDEYVWKWELLHRLGAIRVPVLAGRWTAEAKPVETDGVSRGLTETANLDVVVRQRWLSMSVVGEGPRSHFHSITGYIHTDGVPILGYEYVNEPKVDAPATMQVHRGTVRLVLSDDKLKLDGEYYSGRSRQNIGSFALKKNIS